MANKKLFLFVIFLIILPACAAGETAVQSAPTATAIPATETAVPPTDTPPPTLTPEPEIVLEPGDPERGQAVFENGGAHEAQVVLEAADPQHGREIFLNGGVDELYEPKFACATCHSLDGTVGGEDGHGPSLLGVADRAGERVPGLSAEEYLRQSILEPAAFLAPTYKNRMTKTGAKYLAEEELNDLVAFLLSLSGDVVAAADIKPTPEVEIDLGMSIGEGNAARGEKLTAVTYRCLACHVDDAITGYGPRFSSTEDLPPIWQRGELRIADPGYAGQAATNQAYILESIFLPDVYLVPGEWAERMPNTYHLQLSDQELADIMAWLVTFE